MLLAHGRGKFFNLKIDIPVLQEPKGKRSFLFPFFFMVFKERFYFRALTGKILVCREDVPVTQSDPVPRESSRLLNKRISENFPEPHSTSTSIHFKILCTLLFPPLENDHDDDGMLFLGIILRHWRFNSDYHCLDGLN
jgi:hypothetical protein